MTTKIWYLLFTNEKELLGTPSSAKAPHIGGLKVAIKEVALSYLEDVRAFDLVVWRCKKLLLSTQRRRELQEHVLKVDFGNREQVIRLTNGARIADLELGKKEILLVQVPGAISNSSFLSCSQVCPLVWRYKTEEEEVPSIKYRRTFQFFLYDQAC